MNQLSKRFDVEERAYTRLRKITEAKVARWEYWNGFHWHWDPAEIKSQENAADPKYPSKPTTREKALYAYGYDFKNRVVIIRAGFPIDKSDLSEEFIRYSGNTLSCSKFYSGQLLEVAAAAVTKGKVVRVEEIGSASDWHSVEWRGDQVTRILFGMFGEKPGLEWCYDKSGQLTGMFDLPRKLRLPKGVTFKSLEKTIYERLMQLVPEVVGKVGINQPAYCLAMAYDGEGNGVLPPALGIGLESERRNWMKKEMKESKSLIWNPAEFRHYETKQTSFPSDRKFERACDCFNKLVERKESDASARRLLNKVARDLSRLNWNGKAPVTDDFVVFAVDYEGRDLLKNLKESVSKEKFSRLKAAKFL